MAPKAKTRRNRFSKFLPCRPRSRILRAFLFGILMFVFFNFFLLFSWQSDEKSSLADKGLNNDFFNEFERHFEGEGVRSPEAEGDSKATKVEGKGGKGGKEGKGGKKEQEEPGKGNLQDLEDILGEFSQEENGIGLPAPKEREGAEGKRRIEQEREREVERETEREGETEAEIERERKEQEKRFPKGQENPFPIPSLIPPSRTREDEENPPSFQEILKNYSPNKERGRKGLFPETVGTLVPKVSPTVVFGKPDSSNSYVEHFPTDPLKMRICRFFRTCFNSTHTLLLVSSPDDVITTTNLLSLCDQKGPSAHPSCPCFSGTSRRHVAITSIQEPMLEGATWVVDRNRISRNLGEWGMAMGMLHSMLLEASSFGLGDPSSLVFLKDRRQDLSSHEQALLQIALAPLTKKGGRAEIPSLWADDVSHNPRGMMCFQEAYSTAVTSRVSMSQQHSSLFRLEAFDHFGFDLASPCPPKKTFLLRQGLGRGSPQKILNDHELFRILKTLGFLDVEMISSAPENPSLQQALLFNQAGLIVSPHSEDLFNAIFMHPNASVIQIVPAVFSYDYAQLGLDLGLPMWFAVGGSAPGIPVPPNAVKCNQLFKNCVGEPRCCRQKQNGEECSKESGYQQYAKEVKAENFEADVKAFERVAKEMVKFLDRACGGNWPGVIHPLLWL